MAQTRNTVQELRLALERALEDKEVFVHLNGQAEEVSLPMQLMGSPNVTLKLSHYYRGPLTISETEVQAELLFPEGAHTCVVPIKHIWGITQMSGESRFWPEHAPREILEEMVRGVVTDEPIDEGALTKDPQPQTPTRSSSDDSSLQSDAKKRHAALTRIDSPESKVSAQDGPAPEEREKPSPSLKRIK